MERKTSGSTPEFEWYKRFPRRYIDATRRLSPKARFVYSELIDQIMMLDGPVPDAINWLACQLHAKPRYVREGLDELIAAGKIERTEDGKLINRRCAENIGKRHHQSSVNASTAINRERVRRESVKSQRQVGNESAKHFEPEGDVHQPEYANKDSEGEKNSCHETSTTRARIDSDLESERESTDRESSRPRAPTADASLFAPEECGHRLIVNGVGFKWADPRTGEPRKLSYDWCQAELRHEPVELVREFVQSEILAALDQDKSGNLIGWVRFGIEKRFESWKRKRADAADRRRREPHEPGWQGTLEPGAWEN